MNTELFLEDFTIRGALSRVLKLLWLPERAGVFARRSEEGRDGNSPNHLPDLANAELIGLLIHLAACGRRCWL
jgi:hypothetical protein